MSDTVVIQLPTGVWTDVSAGATEGVWTNAGQVSILYRQHTSAPLPSEHTGHVLHPQTERDFRLPSGYRVYAKPTGPFAGVAVTPSFGAAQLVNAQVHTAAGVPIEAVIPGLQPAATILPVIALPSGSTATVDTAASPPAQAVLWVLAMFSAVGNLRRTLNVQATYGGSGASHTIYGIVGDTIPVTINVTESAGVLSLIITNNHSSTVDISGVRIKV